MGRADIFLHVIVQQSLVSPEVLDHVVERNDCLLNLTRLAMHADDAIARIDTDTELFANTFDIAVIAAKKSEFFSVAFKSEDVLNFFH